MVQNSGRVEFLEGGGKLDFETCFVAAVGGLKLNSYQVLCPFSNNFSYFFIFL